MAQSHLLRRWSFRVLFTACFFVGACTKLATYSAVSESKWQTFKQEWLNAYNYALEPDAQTVFNKVLADANDLVTFELTRSDNQETVDQAKLVVKMIEGDSTLIANHKHTARSVINDREQAAELISTIIRTERTKI